MAAKVIHPINNAHLSGVDRARNPYVVLFSPRFVFLWNLSQPAASGLAGFPSLPEPERSGIDLPLASLPPDDHDHHDDQHKQQ